MKLTAFFLTAFLLNVQASGVSQSITLSVKEAPLKQVFAAIERQTGYFVFFKRGLLSDTKPVTLSVADMPLSDFLDLLLKDQPLKVSFTDKNIFLSKKPVAVVSYDRELKVPFLTISGQILDPDKKPLSGATITVSGSGLATFTDRDGYFTLSGVSENAVIIVSSINFTPLTLRLVNGDLTINDKEFKDQLISSSLQNIILILNSKVSILDEVRVIAYGTTTRRFDVGSANTVTSKEIENQPVSNLLLALQGLVPGLTITPTSGAPGSSVKVQIRGPRTIGFVTDQPLFIIDGVPFAPQNNNTNQLPSFGTTNRNFEGGISPFNAINPHDIESVTVLKDADATSIYGSQGSKGVILITTKKGGGGKPNLEITANSKIDITARPLKMLNTQQYLDLRKEAFKMDELDIPSQGANAADLNVFDQNKYTNWYNEFFGKTAYNTDIIASLRGGTNQTNYIASAGYTVSKFNFPGDFANQRLTTHTAFHNSGMGERLTIDFGTIFTYQKDNSSGSPLLDNAFRTVPNAPDLLDANGNLVWNYKGFKLGQTQQFAYLKQPSNQQTYFFDINLGVGYKITEGLNFRINGGYSRLNAEEYQALPQSSQDPSDPFAPPVSSASFVNTNFQTINLEPQLGYLIKKGKNSLNVMIGGTYKTDTRANTVIKGVDYPNDALLTSVSGANSITANNGSIIYKYIAGFGRINYIYDEKYIVNLSGRRDGSTNFGPGRQFGNFGSIGMGWIFSSEKAIKKAIKKALPFISFGKLYGSYGTVGGDGIKPYQYQSFWQPIAFINAFQGLRPYTILNHYNPVYSWSLEKTINTSMALGFLKDRILVNATWYRSRNGNQLIDYQLPSQTGFSTVLQNSIATLQNTGLEFTLSSKNIQTKNITWSTDFNISINRNKLIAFDGLETSSYAGAYEIGQSINISRLYEFKGLNTTTGIYEFNKIDGKVTNNPSYGIPSQGGDLKEIVDFQPKFTGGFGNTIVYKKFSLYSFFYFEKKTGQNYLGSIYQNGSGPGYSGNLPVQTLDHWKNPGDNTPFQRISTGLSYQPIPYSVKTAANAFSQSTGIITDASYISLNTLSLSYNLPDAYLKIMKLRNFRIYVNAQNLFIITSYKVGDPRNQNLYSFPFQRSINGGLSFNL